MTLGLAKAMIVGLLILCGVLFWQSSEANQRADRWYNVYFHICDPTDPTAGHVVPASCKQATDIYFPR